MGAVEAGGASGVARLLLVEEAHGGRVGLEGDEVGGAEEETEAYGGGYWASIRLEGSTRGEWRNGRRSQGLSMCRMGGLRVIMPLSVDWIECADDRAVRG